MSPSLLRLVGVSPTSIAVSLNNNLLRNIHWTRHGTGAGCSVGSEHRCFVSVHCSFSTRTRPRESIQATVRCDLIVTLSLFDQLQIPHLPGEYGSSPLDHTQRILSACGAPTAVWETSYDASTSFFHSFIDTRDGNIVFRKYSTLFTS